MLNLQRNKVLELAMKILKVLEGRRRKIFLKWYWLASCQRYTYQGWPLWRDYCWRRIVNKGKDYTLYSWIWKSHLTTRTSRYLAAFEKNYMLASLSLVNSIWSINFPLGHETHVQLKQISHTFCSFKWLL